MAAAHGDSWGARLASEWTAAHDSRLGSRSAPEWAAAVGAGVRQCVRPADGIRGGRVGGPEGVGTLSLPLLQFQRPWRHMWRAPRAAARGGWPSWNRHYSMLSMSRGSCTVGTAAAQRWPRALFEEMVVQLAGNAKRDSNLDYLHAVSMQSECSYC
jgi:hypothetical protein